MIEKILKEINRLKNELDGYSALEALDYIESYINTLPKEPASESLEEEVHKHLLNIGATIEMYSGNVMGLDLCEDDYVDFARHFAEWQKNKMKEALQTEYEKGRFDMREEMMKDAVEGEVVYKIGNAEIAPTDIRYKVMSDRVYIPNVKLGDKVKIIIIKEN